MVDRFHSVVSSQSSCPKWNALAFYPKCTHNKSKPFLVKPKFWKRHLEQRSTRFIILDKMLWPFTTSAHARCMPFLAPISFLWRRRRDTFSCLFLNENHELSRSHSRQSDVRRQELHSWNLLPCWFRSKAAGVAYQWTYMHQLLLPKLVKVTLGGIFV